MEKKTLLLATFINENEIEDFLYKIYKNFGIKKKSVFIFETEIDIHVLTFKLFIDIDQKINIKKDLPNTIQIHKKGTTFFTINSLNRLIELEYGLNLGNIEYSKYSIDWQKFNNSIISIRNNNLEILKLNRKILEL